ncbi:YbaB/EbfC family DNA-binding protein [Actinokineospora sp. PR83]|uniref:YbaB/EbfC family DNA-binding protein n=1 Tax=Actinokineospora sp. PR83 TaxID=2884908 RepID=UPI001F282F82|nr:YbaB/EbfC family DNA-binding protein [Actinokineospora sp. PR83]MCG8916457.1 YbaB/EbfC family DNA-binding protein [Actinokineospora sp. PR83]
MNWSSMSEADLRRMADDAMADLDRERAKLGELGRLWDENTTVHAKDRSLSMTVDGRGELLEMAFTGGKYKSMPPAQLAHVIVETLGRAKAESMAKISEAMGDPGVPGLDVAGIASGKVDPMEMVNSLLGPMLEGIGGLDALGGTTTDNGRRKSDG